MYKLYDVFQKPKQTKNKRIKKINTNKKKINTAPTQQLRKVIKHTRLTKY